MTFAFVESASTADSTSTTRTVNLTGSMTPTAGDVIIVWAGGRGTVDTFTFTADSGWVDIGSIIRCDYPSGPSGNRYGAMHAWWKISDGTETSVTVTRSGGSIHRAGAALYRSSTTETATILGTPQDDTTGSTSLTAYTPPSPTVIRTVNLIEIVQAHTDISGTMSTDNAQGFTVRPQNPAGSIRPVTNIYDLIVTAGTHTMPTSSIGGLSRPWTSKTFALAAQLPPSSGWSVGMIQW
jgi:hypothetical protein